MQMSTRPSSSRASGNMMVSRRRTHVDETFRMRSLFMNSTLAFFLASLLFTVDAPAQGSASSGDSRAQMGEAQDPSVGFAETNHTKPTLEQARKAFAEGRALMDEQQWLHAARKFEYALRAKNTPGLRYYVGYCLEREGKLVEALAHFEDARRLLDTAPAADVAEVVPIAIERVEAKVAILVLRGLPPEASVELNGRILPRGERFRVNPGRGYLIIRKDGFVEYGEELNFAPATTEVVNVKLVPLATRRSDSSSSASAEDRSNESTDPRKRSTARSVVFWSGIGLSSATLITGAGGVMLFTNANASIRIQNDKLDDLEPDGGEACAAPTPDAQIVCDDLEASQKKKRQGTALMIGSAAAFAAGVFGAIFAEYFWPDAPLDVGVAAGPGGGQLSLTGRF
jgi:hypothetical protein